jgi:membrane protein implicated in regulation of membrane protease activity
MDKIEILDVVALTEDLRDLRRGEVGTVVEKWKEGVFEVEFSDSSGRAYAFAALHPEQLMRLHFRKGEAA